MVPAARKNHFLGWCLFVLPKNNLYERNCPDFGPDRLFMLAGYQAEQINKRRADAARELDYHRWKKNGAMIHVGNPVEAGQPDRPGHDRCGMGRHARKRRRSEMLPRRPR